MRKNEEKLNLSKEEKKKIIEEIQYFFEEERDEKIGMIASEKVYDFFVDILGDKLYNKALDDAILWYKRNIENMESDFYALYKS